jgi:hypothetical protein
MYLLIEAEDPRGDVAIALSEGQPLTVYPGLRVRRCYVTHDLGELCRFVDALQSERSYVRAQLPVSNTPSR